MNSGDQISMLWELAKDRPWPLVAAFVITGVVRAIKSAKISPEYCIPPRWRPAVSLVIGWLSGCAEAVFTGIPIVPALGANILAATVAIAGHDLIIEGFRNGREIGHPKPLKEPPTTAAEEKQA